jgi:predicted dehydrogenase
MVDSGTIDAVLGPVFDRDAQRATTFAGANDMTSVGSLDEVLDRCDAVWVCTPTTAHGEAVEAAAAAGTAVFCEKPLDRDLAGVRRMVSVVTAHDVQAQVGLVLRSAPVFRALRDVLASGELGVSMAAVFRDDQYFPTQGHYASTWRSDVDVAGGGCLLEHSIHDLDILRFCLGEVVEVSARTANFAGHRGIEDVAGVQLRFRSGATADLVSVWHDILSRPSTRRLEVFCERGLAWLDDDFLGPLHIETSDGVDVRPCSSPGWVDDLPLPRDRIGRAVRLYAAADRAFVDALQRGDAPEPSFVEAEAAHVLADAAYRSAAGGGAPITLG